MIYSGGDVIYMVVLNMAPHAVTSDLTYIDDQGHKVGISYLI